MQTKICDHWDAYLSLFSPNDKDVYFCEEYVSLYAKGDVFARCAIVQDGPRVLLMPFLQRKINDDLFDFETAYGYGGPIANNHDQDWISLALQEMKSCLKASGCLCGFIRFHPLLGNSVYCAKEIGVSFDRKTVAIRTELSEDEIWTKELNAKNRNMIRKAEKNGLVFRMDPSLEYLGDFVKLYSDTMKRLGADDFYFFDDDYYENLKRLLCKSIFLGTVWKEDRLVCGALFMVSAPYGHYHLEGSDRDFSSLGANNLLLWKTAVEMHKMGIKEFHLGGGYNSDNDNSLLRFKKDFSQNQKDFCIGKMVFDVKRYNEIVLEWSKRNPEKVEKFKNRLLCYRY